MEICIDNVPDDSICSHERPSRLAYGDRLSDVSPEYHQGLPRLHSDVAISIRKFFRLFLYLQKRRQEAEIAG